ncbi:hypothetical protein ACH4UM_14555 [Streptomyces sp. NPDC020801]|uniref:hypothetical protein n=1 Tax=unclassified Streptomyces TaxID=2593676 RepID=UPI0037900B5C
MKAEGSAADGAHQHTASAGTMINQRGDGRHGRRRPDTYTPETYTLAPAVDRLEGAPGRDDDEGDAANGSAV